MPYTLWHCGVLIGETDFERPGNSPGQQGGAFRPTAYGRELYPRMSGMMTAAADLKEEMQQRGVSDDTEDVDEMLDLMETTDAGRRIVDVGRVLSEVELRDPDGRPLEFASIAFMDLEELDALTSRLDCRSDDFDAASRDPRAPRFIVSATLLEKRCHTDERSAPADDRKIEGRSTTRS